MIMVPLFGSRRIVIPRPAMRSMPASLELRARAADAIIAGVLPATGLVAGLRNQSTAVAVGK